MSRLAVALVLLTATATAALADDEIEDANPYLYQRLGAAGPSRVELETAVGSREARPFGEDGVETAARVEIVPLPGLSLSARAGLLVTGGDGERHGSFSAEAGYRIFLGPLTLRAGAGYERDYRDDDLLRFRFLLSTQRGRLGLLASAIVEVPFAEGRDTVDLVLGVAAAWSVVPRLRLGAEALAEDIEAAWEADEAEGGARLLAGPTAWLAIARRIDLKLGAAVTATAGETGFLGRVAVGLTF